MIETVAESHTEELQQRNRELSILNTIAGALNAEVDLSRALHTALAQVAALFGLETGWIWLLDEKTGEAYLAAAQNLPPGLANYPRRMEGICYCLDTFRSGDMDGAANVNVVTCSRLRQLAKGSGGLRYHASVPLYAHGKHVGLLNVTSADWRELSPADLRLLYTVGDLLGIAVERARLFARSAEMGAVEERNRLAREIHDTLAQGLAAIALQLETADALLETHAPNGNHQHSERAQQAVQQALEMARTTLEDARRSVMDLRAAPLEGHTLAEALEEMVVEWAAKANLRADFEATGSRQPLPIRVEAGLYRIAQEALTNVIKHANAKHLRMRLIVTPEQAQLQVADDGVGFDPQQIPENHYGLLGLNERAKLLGGKLCLGSCPEVGTHVEVTVPLETGR